MSYIGVDRKDKIFKVSALIALVLSTIVCPLYDAFHTAICNCFLSTAVLVFTNILSIRLYLFA